MSHAVLATPGEPTSNDGLVVSAFVIAAHAECGDFADARVLAGAACQRVSMEEAVQECAGLVFSGHGVSEPMNDGIALAGHEGDAALVDTHNVSMLSGRWVHAIACRSAGELAREAVLNGVAAWAGYTSALHVDFDPEVLPLEGRALFEQFVTVTSCLLARGERCSLAIKGELDEPRLALVAWVDEQLESFDALTEEQVRALDSLRWFTEQLVDRLEVHVAVAAPE